MRGPGSLREKVQIVELDLVLVLNNLVVKNDLDGVYCLLKVQSWIRFSRFGPWVNAAT
jgi:hypothetical protein